MNRAFSREARGGSLKKVASRFARLVSHRYQITVSAISDICIGIIFWIRYRYRYHQYQVSVPSISDIGICIIDIRYLMLSHRILSVLILAYVVLPYLMLFYLTLPCRILPYLKLAYLILESYPRSLKSYFDQLDQESLKSWSYLSYPRIFISREMMFREKNNV